MKSPFPDMTDKLRVQLDATTDEVARTMLYKKIKALQKEQRLGA